MMAQPVRMTPSPTGRAADGALGHLDEDRPGIDDGTRRCHVLLDPDAAAPDGQQPTDPPDQPLAPGRGEGGRPAAQEPAARLGRQGVLDDERVDPSSMRRRDEEVAARRRQMLLPEVRIWNRRTTNATKRATNRMSR